MKFKLSVPFVVGVVYIAFISGSVMADVGRLPSHASEPYPWWLPIEFLVLLGIPFVTGLLAGRESMDPD